MKIIKRFLLSLENPDMPLLGPNIWIMKKIGLILPKNKFAKFAYILLHEVVTLFVATQYMELYVIRSDLDQIITNLKISMLSIVCIVKSNTCIMWQNIWEEIIDYITKADKDERDDQSRARKDILDSYTKYCRRITYFYWLLVFITFVTVVTTPLLRHFTESERNEPFYHIFSSWMPFEKNSSPGCWITVIWHASLCAYGATIMAAFDISAMVIMVYFGGKFDLLRERCKEMLGKCGNGVSDIEACRMFRKMHHIHVCLIKYARIFNSLLSPVMFLYVLMCSLMLCASAFQLNLVQNGTQKILMAEYLIFGVAQLFMYCWHSNIVLHKSLEVTRGPYESDWWCANVKQRKDLHLLMGQMARTVNFNAGPFTNLSLATFINILKGAYSYYTLLRK